MALRVCIVGATGATGRRVAAEGLAGGHEVVLVGRNTERLRGLARELGGGDLATVALDDAHGLRRCVGDASVAVNCVGPFGRFGAPTLQAAVATGTPYVDTSGEPAFALAVLQAGHNATAPLVTAVGASALLADVATASAMRSGSSDAPERLTISYRIDGMRPSVGTLRSEIEMLADGAVVVAGGRLTRTRAVGARVAFPGGAGIRFPTPDAVVVSRYCRAGEIDACLETPVSRVVGAAMAGAAAGCARPRLRAGLRRALANASLPDGADHGRFAATAHLGESRSTASAEGVYGFTARAVVHVACLAARALGPVGLCAATQLGDVDEIATALDIGVRTTTHNQGAEL